MAHRIADGCINCGTCAGECPVPDCIREEPHHFVIDGTRCLDCGLCLPVCPVEAISPPEPRLTLGGSIC